MGSYPRQLTLDVLTQERLISYLIDELQKHRAERQPAIDDLMQAQADYWAKPSQERRTFPFTGAANVIIPLTAIAYETIHARSITTLFAIQPFTSVKARRGDLEPFDKPLEDYFQYELTHNVKIYRPVNDILAELEKFGTGIGKSGYEKTIRKAVRPSPGGQGEAAFPVVVKDGATLDPVPNANFIMPHYAKDPQTAPWCGEYHSAPPYQVMLHEYSGLFKPGVYKALEGYYTQNSVQGTWSERRYERKLEELENRRSIWPNLVDWREIWLCFDVDNDRQEEEIVVHFHEDARLLMSVRYNWHDDLHRPYRTGNYIIVENRWRGIGICKQNEQFQRSITTQHRQRLDNATIANMRMFKVHRLSGYGPKEPIFPGKMWFLEDMTHIESFEMGDVRQSAFLDEQNTLVYSQMRTGVNEVVMGMPATGTPGTATGDLARIREGQQKFDYIMKNEKMLIGDLLLDVFCNIHQFGPKNISYFDWADGGQQVKQLLSTIPTSALREGILFEVGAAGVTQNRVLDRQNWVQIAGILQNYYTGTGQLVQMLANPQLMMLFVQKALSGSTEAVRQILESFDVRNVDKMVLTELVKMLGGAPNGNGGGSSVPLLGPGGNQGPAGNGAPSRMDAFAQMLAGAGGNGPS